jgi:hypothetical protein
MNTDTTISWLFICSVVTLASNLFGIYFAFSNKKVKERERDEATQQKIEEKFEELRIRSEAKSEDETQKRINDEKNFLQINLKLDTFNSELRTMARNSDKTSNILNQLQQHIVLNDSRLDNHDKVLEDHSERIHRLEESNNNEKNH